MSDIKYVFFDIETLSTNKNALVLSAGFLVMDPQEDKTFEELVKSGIEVKFKAKEQENRHILKDTMDWWAKQGPSAQRVLVPNDDIDISVEDFYEAIEPLGYVQDAYWYCKGPHFDAAIMESLFEQFHMKAPWGYSKIRDVRTWFECAVGTTRPFEWPEHKPESFIEHNALHDAAYDAFQMLQILHHGD